MSIIEVAVKGGGVVNRINFYPWQKEEKLKGHRDNVSFNEEGAIKEAKRIINGWIASEQFIGKRLVWRKA